MDRKRARELYVEILRQMRLDAGMSEQELSLAIGEDEQYIGRVERGIERVDLPTFTRIAEVLGRDPLEVVRKLYRVVIEPDESS